MRILKGSNINCGDSHSYGQVRDATFNKAECVVVSNNKLPYKADLIGWNQVSGLSLLFLRFIIIIVRPVLMWYKLYVGRIVLLILCTFLWLFQISYFAQYTIVKGVVHYELL